MVQSGRYVAPSPPQWAERARYIAATRYAGAQALVREAIDGALLSGECWPIGLADRDGLSTWLEMLDSDGLDGLREMVEKCAERIASETHCTRVEAALFLVADAPIALPYIVVEAEAAPLSLTQRATIHVADIDAQAEEVRSAWVEGTRHLLGVEANHRRPGVGAVPLIVFDANAAARGLSWPKRYAEWVPVARHLGLEEYGGTAWADAPAEPWRAYMNRVKRLRRNHRWLDELWFREHVGQKQYQENAAIIAKVAQAARSSGGLEEAARVVDTHSLRKEVKTHDNS